MKRAARHVESQVRDPRVLDVDRPVDPCPRWLEKLVGAQDLGGLWTNRPSHAHRLDAGGHVRQVKRLILEIQANAGGNHRLVAGPQLNAGGGKETVGKFQRGAQFVDRFSAKQKPGGLELHLDPEQLRGTPAAADIAGDLWWRRKIKEVERLLRPGIHQRPQRARVDTTTDLEMIIPGGGVLRVSQLEFAFGPGGHEPRQAPDSIRIS